MKKFLITILIVYILIPILLIILDILNISPINITRQYDWLAFIGAYVSGLCTLILGIVSIKQNENLSNINMKMLKNDMISSTFSQIDVEDDNYFDVCMTKDYSNSFGIKMKQANVDENDDLVHIRLILQFFDRNNYPLLKGSIDKIDIYYDYTQPYINESKLSYITSENEENLEVTPKREKITYYLPICLIDKKENLDSFLKCKNIRVVSHINIKNSFNVVSKAEYTIHLAKDVKAQNDWIRYKVAGRKIYYKEIMYEA